MEGDMELLAKLRGGSDEAFAQLVVRYQPRLQRLAASMLPSAAVAEEVVQDTWMAVVKGVEGFEGRSSFKTWLFHILANRARSAGAHEQRSGAVSAPSVDPSFFDEAGSWRNPVEPWTDRVDEEVDASRLRPLLMAALGSLPDRQRQVVMLRDVEGLSSDDVCRVLALSSANERVLLHRGRARLRQVLDDHMRGR